MGAAARASRIRAPNVERRAGFDGGAFGFIGIVEDYKPPSIDSKA
jgi:hypothetical protein